MWAACSRMFRHDLRLRNERGVGTDVFVCEIGGGASGKAALPTEFLLEVGCFVGNERGHHFHEDAAFLEVFAGNEFGVGVEGADDLARRKRTVARRRENGTEMKERRSISSSVRSKSRLRKRESPLEFFHDHGTAGGEDLSGDATPGA